MACRKRSGALSGLPLAYAEREACSLVSHLIRFLNLRQLLVFISLLIKGVQRVTAGHHPVARSGCAVAERATYTFALKRVAMEYVKRQFGIGQHHAANAHKIGHPPPHRCLSHVWEPVLQIGIAGAYDEYFRTVFFELM